MKYLVLAGLVSLGLFATGAQAQDEEGGRSDISVSGTANLEQSTTGNGVQQNSTSSGGILVSYRYFFTSHIGVQADYGWTKFSQQYNPLVTTTALSGLTDVPVNVQEATASLVYKFHVGRIQPFVNVGTGALLFVPTSSLIAGVSNTGTFLTPTALYGAGADVPLGKRITFRVGYRGYIYDAPDFGVSGTNTKSLAHMIQPFAGFSYRF